MRACLLLLTGGRIWVAQTRLLRIQTDNGEGIKLVWHLVVRQDDWWYDAHVDALDGVVLSLVDWVADATYLVRVNHGAHAGQHALPTQFHRRAPDL